ncbi:MAG: hypothetical protein ACRC7G_15970, partial [Beijerinckiaceae bacterium]
MGSAFSFSRVCALAVLIGTGSSISRAETTLLPLPEPPALPQAADIAAPLPVQPLVAVPLPDPVALPAPVVRPEQPAVVVVPPPAPAAPALEPPRTIGDIPPEVLKAAVERMRPTGRMSARDAEDIRAFYAARDHRPLWIGEGRWNAVARTARLMLEQADDHGLDPTHYRSVAAFVPTEQPHWPALAAAELQLTEAVLTYGRDAMSGRIDPGRVHPLVTPSVPVLMIGETLAKLADATSLEATMTSFHPPHAAFNGLRNELRRLRTARAAAPVSERLPDGPAIRMGMRDPRVPLIRARLGLGLGGGAVYDRELSIKVAGLQKASGLPVNGIFTPQTRRALSGEGTTPEEAEIIANMERWRWLPRELGQEHIWVNLPELEMRLVRGDTTTLASRVILGTEETQTPVFSDEMDHIVVNPSWYVPPGIL